MSKHWPEVTLTRPQDVLMPGTPVANCSMVGCQEPTAWFVNSAHQGVKVRSCGMHLDELATMAADGKFDA